MYAKNNNYVTFFTDNHNKNTDKVVYGKVSEAIKTNRKDENDKVIYEFETWNARFVGKAFEKVSALEDKTPITLTEWSVRCPYSKEKKKSYPYIMVMDFEVRENSNNSELGDGFVNIPDGIDEELPFE